MSNLLLRIVSLKPFDEEADKVIAGRTYANSTLLTIGVVATAALAVAALILNVEGSALGMPSFGAAIAVSAVTAGLEWNAGLRGLAKNQLFVTVMIALAVAILNRLT